MKYKILIIVIGFLSFVSHTHAQKKVRKSNIAKDTTVLEEIIIKANPKRKKEIGKTVVGKKRLAKEMITDSKDLIRYIPGVNISNSGSRGGTRGFAIRGVEANRVAISVDGIQQPEIHENIVFSAYGLSNTSRIEFDPYFVSAIDIQKGSASFAVGSGALGGAVNYTTKRVEDLLLPDKDYGAVFQMNYNSRDNLMMYLGGAGYKKDKWEGLVLFANRKGNEINNFSYGELSRNVTSTQVDPMDYKQQTFLAKIAFLPNTKNRIEFSYYMLNKQVDTEIWSQEPLDIFTSADNPYYFSSDQSLNHSWTLNYTLKPENTWLKKLDIRTNLQRTYLDAATWSEYFRPNFYGGGNYNLVYEGRRDKYRGQEISDFTAKANLNFQVLDANKWGIHKFSATTAVTNKYNDNRNVDVENPTASNDVDGYTVRLGKHYEFGESMGKIINAYSFQRPINRLNYQLGLMDNILITPQLKVNLGIRYDVFHTKDQNWDYDNDTYYMDYLMRNMGDIEMNQSRIDDSDYGLSWLATANYRFDNYLNVGYKFSTGFRMPTTEERYFQYFNSWPSFLVLSNSDLKPETSTNNEIEISGNNRTVSYMVNTYYTNYKNFIDIEQGTIEVSNVLDNSKKKISYAKNVNRETAKLWGLDVKMDVQLEEFWNVLQGVSFNAAASYAKGDSSYGTSMLGVQPLTGFLGFEYLSENQKWNANFKINIYKAKDREDTRFIEHTALKEIERAFSGLFLEDAFTFDVYGSYHVSKNFTVRAGVYNIFNTKYWRWDDLRQLTNPALLPHIENFFREGTKTISRFSQPKRYFNLSLELNF